MVRAVVEARRPKRQLRRDILVVEEVFWVVEEVVMVVAWVQKVSGEVAG